MQKVKRICIRITPGRFAAAVLLAASMVNLIIVKAAFDASSNFIPITSPTLTSPSSTGTFVVSTATPGETFTPASTVTHAATQTVEPTSTSAPTETPVSVSTYTPSPTACAPRTGWVIYFVQRGDTLFRIAFNTGTNVAELKLANCLIGDQIFPGQSLYVPRLPPTVTPNTITPEPPPDLVVIRFQVMDAAKIDVRQRTIAVPIQAVVQNQGGSAAGIFKLSARYFGSDGEYTIPFAVFDQGNLWYPFTTTPLPAGQLATFTGLAYLPYAAQGQTAAFTVLADSCDGDEAMPLSCRVNEGDEGNNESHPIQITLPSNYPPSVVISNPDADTSYVFDGYDQKLGLSYKDIFLAGFAADPEDGVLDGSSLIWTTDRTDISIYKDSIIGGGAAINIRLYLNDCNGHTITLTATDSAGNVVTATRKIGATCLY